MNETSFQRSVFSTQRIATKVGASNLTGCVDTTNVGAERLANARAYMQTLFAQEIELHPDTTATFVTNAGNNYDERYTFFLNYARKGTKITKICICHFL